MGRIDELGRVVHDKSYNPFSLENRRAGMFEVDRIVSETGMHFERLVASGISSSHLLPAQVVCIAMAMKDGQEPLKEQILILDHFVLQCRKALTNFELDGTLPDGIKARNGDYK